MIKRMKLNEMIRKARFAISKNAWISSIDYQTDEEITIDEALAFLREVKE